MIDQDRYGRTQRAFRREDGALLLLHRPRSRNAEWYNRIGTWAVVVEDVLVARQHVYGRRGRATPTRWANSVLKKWIVGSSGALCHLYDGRRPTVVESLLHSAAPLSQLPQSLVRLPVLSAKVSELTNHYDNIRVQLPIMPPLSATRTNLGFSTYPRSHPAPNPHRPYKCIRKMHRMLEFSAFLEGC